MMLKYQFQNGREGNAFEDIPEDFSWQDLINLLGDKEKVRESIKWKDDLKLTKFVSRPVSLKIDLSADAKVYAIRFDDLFWD